MDELSPIETLPDNTENLPELPELLYFLPPYNSPRLTQKSINQSTEIVVLIFALLFLLVKKGIGF